jgi:hypothetical protein
VKTAEVSGVVELDDEEVLLFIEKQGCQRRQLKKYALTFVLLASSLASINRLTPLASRKTSLFTILNLDQW